MTDLTRMEYTELPDEFNGQKAFTDAEPVERKRKWNWITASAAVLLILPLVLPGFLRPSGSPPEPVVIVDPEPGPVPQPAPVPEPEPEPEPEPGGEHPDYDIVGVWYFEGETYFFSLDGGGFYNGGSVYDRVNWQEAGADYSYAGGGVTGFDFFDTETVNFSGMTRPGDGGLYLLSNVTGQDELFTPMQSTNLPEGYPDYASQPIEDTVMGYWMLDHTVEDPDAVSVFSYYLELAEGNKGMIDMRSYDGEYTSYIFVHYEIDPDEPYKITLTALEGGPIFFEFYEDGYHATFEKEELIVYYYVDSEGEALLFRDYSGGSVMRKETDY